MNRTAVTLQTAITARWPLALVVLALATLSPGARSEAAPPLFWCPEKPRDQQLSGAPEPGCVPLVEKERRRKAAKAEEAAPSPLKIEDLERESPRFLHAYRRFVECCAYDVLSLSEAEALEERGNDLLELAQEALFSEQVKLRGWTVRELVGPVARARDNLRSIRARLERLRSLVEQLGTLQYEEAGRARLRVQEEQEALLKEFRPALPPPSPPTGMEIGVTSPFGPAIGTVPPTGPEIGTAPPTGTVIGATPPTGKEIGQTPPTGFEIGTTGKVGPEIGEAAPPP